MACGTQTLCCLLLALAALPSDWLLPVIIAQETSQAPTGAPEPGSPLAVADASGPTGTPECREEQFPCTRLYSVHKPVKQCISYLCITSVRRTYMINKEICTRMICKEDEAMQEELCRQMAGLPARRFRRANHPRGPRGGGGGGGGAPCRRQARDHQQQQNGIEAQ